MLRMGLVGCGTHANWAVVPGITKAASAIKLVAVADLNAENLARIEVRPDVQRFSSHRDMLASAQLDAVYIATLADSHAAIALDAFAAGCHVLCEKPMASSVEDCQRMVEAADRADRVLAVNFETRYHAETQQVKAWISQGYLGQIEAIHIQHFWDGHKATGPLSARRFRLADLAGTLDCGIHKADQIRFFCSGNWQELTARGRWFGEKLSKPPHIAVLASLDNGVLATLNSSFSYGAYMTPKAYSDVLTIVGSTGVINFFQDRLQPSLVRLHSEKLTAEFAIEETGHASAMALLMKDFAAAVAGEVTPSLPLGRDGLQAQLFVEQANEEAVSAQQQPAQA